VDLARRQLPASPPAQRQPESFVPFPDLHFDRVSATASATNTYRYRILSSRRRLFPASSAQCRAWSTTIMPTTSSARATWDYLGLEIFAAFVHPTQAGTTC